MLTEFHQFPELNDELRLHMLQQHIFNVDFPKTLLSFSVTDSHNNALAKDWTLWRQAIEIYFPTLVTYKKATYLKDPLALFKATFSNIQPVLATHHLTFSEFVKAVIEQQVTLDEGQLDVLQGLLLAAGHPLLPGTTLNSAIHEHALLFAALLGNSGLVDKLLTERKFPISKTVVCQALMDAARLNHQFILGSLLTNMNQFLDGATIRNALTSAASLGHTRIVAQFLQPPYLRIVSFTLKKVVHIAITHDYPDMLAIILRGNDLQRYTCDIRAGALEAAEKNATRGIEQAFRLAPTQFDDVTVRKILKAAASLGNNALINLFATNPAIQRHPNALLEALQVAMDQGHENTALLLLQAGRGLIKPFVKRDLFLDAAKRGFNSIIDDLNNQDHLKVDGSFYQSAVNLARIYDHEDTIEHLTTAISQMNLKETAKPITPAFARQGSPFRSQPLGESHLEVKRSYIL